MTVGTPAVRALRSALPARQFTPTVINNLALQYALHTNKPEQFIEAYAMSFEVPGMGGAGNFRQRPVASIADYLFLDHMMPALRAAGETGTAEQILSGLKAFFDNASDTLRHDETPYRLQLFAGNEHYDTLRLAIESALGPDVALFNEYHALIVRHSKEVCRVRPRCSRCVLLGHCPAGA